MAMPSMTGEERVLTALRRQQPDRVPVFIYLDPYTENWATLDPSSAEVLACRRGSAATSSMIGILSIGGNRTVGRSSQKECRRTAKWSPRSENCSVSLLHGVT